MKSAIQDSTKKLIVVLVGVIAGITYVISVFYAYPVYQSIRITDPLALLHSLPPLFYIAIGGIILAGFACFLWDIKGKTVHLFLLLLLAIALWYTPHYMAEFVYSMDSNWHVGVSMHIPEVLAGEQVTFSHYAQDFPGSFVFNYLVINMLGIEAISYIRFFPLFFAVLFILLCYVFISVLFSPRIALLSLILTVPGLHYFMLHPSPRILGVLLMMTVLVLLLKPRLNAGIMALAMITIFVIIASHPISPLLLCVFLGAGVVTSWLYQRKLGKAQAALLILLAFCFAGWFLWQTLIASTPVTEAAPLSVSEQALPSVSEPATPLLIEHGTGAGEGVAIEGLDNVRKLLAGSTFIYSDIANVRRVLYLLYGLLAVAALVGVALATYRIKRSWKALVISLGGLKQNEIFMVLSAAVFLALTVLLIERSSDLAERGLSFLILSLCCVLASIATRYLSAVASKRKTVMLAVMAVLLAFAGFSFPAGAYSSDAYTSCPASEARGLEFMATKAVLDDKTVSMHRVVQLSFFLPHSTIQSAWGGNLDIYVFRSIEYYKAAMRDDLSFEENRFTRRLDRIKADSEYNQVYANPAFLIYQKNVAD